MSDYYTREPTSGYEIIFDTEDKATYEAVKKFCSQMCGGLKPNEPRYELRPIASWIQDGYEEGHLACSQCGAPKPIADLSGAIGPKSIRYCYCCGAKMEEKPDV